VVRRLDLDKTKGIEQLFTSWMSRWQHREAPLGCRFRLGIDPHLRFGWKLVAIETDKHRIVKANWARDMRTRDS